MPSLTFVMPHWLYWAGLLLFPLMALYLVRRQLRKPLPSGPSPFIAYLLALCAIRPRPATGDAPHVWNRPALAVKRHGRGISHCPFPKQQSGA